MRHLGAFPSDFGLEHHGIKNVRDVYWHLSTAVLYEQAVQRAEAVVAHLGPLVTRTGPHTGRAPNDKFIVHEPSTQDDIWWGNVNRPISQQQFNHMHRLVLGYLQNRDLFVFSGYAGADPRYRMPVRVITELAWHNLFARNMFIRELEPEKLTTHVPAFTVIDVPNCLADPVLDGLNSPTFILVDLAQRLVLIGGTHYAGEIKKSIFSVMNYFLPRQGIMPMHCSANYGADKADAALFFGLSGTGKTTLSSEASRVLIGDDEHGWSADGIFNFEGGCYAKVIKLDPEGEPEIYGTTRQFGTILENVGYDPHTRRVRLEDDSITQNTRASYPLSHILNADLGGQAGHPRNVIFLTADAFGVLPPISRLSTAQAMYHFLSGYTAKVAGTEMGVTEPKATFSACFGGPFMPLHPAVYADLLGAKIEQHNTRVWLVNTGWTGGPYGVGSRIKLRHTRAMVRAALAGDLDSVEYITEPYFGLAMPACVPDVPAELLNPRNTWTDPVAYDVQAQKLVAMFNANFAQFADGVAPEVRAAGPQLMQPVAG